MVVSRTLQEAFAQKALAQIEIIGLSNQYQPGVTLAPTLTHLDGVTALGQGHTLACLDFDPVEFTLSNAKLDFGETQWKLTPPEGETLGSATFNALFESVEFEKKESQTGRTADAIDVEKKTLGERPYAVPTGLDDLGQLLYDLREDVAGEIGKLIGTVGVAEEATAKLVGDLTGSLTSDLSADLKQPAVLDEVPKPEIKWQVKDAFDQTVEIHVPDGKPGLDQPAPEFAFFPEFVEFSANASLAPSERRISCTITVKDAEDNILAERLVGPAIVFVPPVPVPSLLVMTEHVNDGRDIGDMLVAVPSSSMINLDKLDDFTPLVFVLQKLETTLKQLQILPGFTLDGESGIFSTITRLINWINSDRRITLIKESQVNDLSAVERDPGDWFLNWGATHWEDCISALVLLGPPGRSITVHDRRNLWTGTGALRVGIDSQDFVARVDNLRDPTEAVPNGATARPFGGGLPASFNDVISSFAFEPLKATG